MIKKIIFKKIKFLNIKENEFTKIKNVNFVGYIQHQI